MTLESLFKNQEFLTAIKNVMLIFKPNFGMCLPMNVLLYCTLEQKFPNYIFKIKTGDLLYNNQILFKQDFDLNQFENSQNNIFKSWKGHAWLEINDQYIVDISIFRTVYSKDFILPIKEDIIKTFGLGRGMLAFDKHNNDLPFHYNEKTILTERMIDGILKGIDTNKEMFFNL